MVYLYITSFTIPSGTALFFEYLTIHKDFIKIRPAGQHYLIYWYGISKETRVKCTLLLHSIGRPVTRRWLQG